MIVLAMTPLAISVLFCVSGPALARQLSGRSSAIVLTFLSLVCALALGLVVCAIGCLAFAEWGPLAGLGHWSPAVVARHAAIPRAVDIACAVIGSSLLVAAAARLIMILAGLRASVAMCRGHRADLVVLDDGRPEAYALAGLPGRTVVTRSMLRLLSAPERRALLAHEHSHVRHYHFAYINLVQLAASANPLMMPLVPAVRLAVERWADDDAAVQVDDRRLVATTLARAGLARNGNAATMAGPALAVADSDVRQRIEALLAPRDNRPVQVVIAVALVSAAVLAGLSSGVVGLHLHNLIEWAQAVQAHHRS